MNILVPVLIGIAGFPLVVVSWFYFIRGIVSVWRMPRNDWDFGLAALVWLVLVCWTCIWVFAICITTTIE